MEKLKLTPTPNTQPKAPKQPDKTYEDLQLELAEANQIPYPTDVYGQKPASTHGETSRLIMLGEIYKDLGPIIEQIKEMPTSAQFEKALNDLWVKIRNIHGEEKGLSGKLMGYQIHKVEILAKEGYLLALEAEQRGLKTDKLATQKQVFIDTLNQYNLDLPTLNSKK